MWLAKPIHRSSEKIFEGERSGNNFSFFCSFLKSDFVAGPFLVGIGEQAFDLALLTSEY